MLRASRNQGFYKRKNVAGRPETKRRKDPLRDAFWYRKVFTVSNEIPVVAVIRVRKAAWGSRVFLNGVLLGDNLSSFMSGFFDAKGAFKTGENELIIRVAADHDSLPEEALEGLDAERRGLSTGFAGFGGGREK